MPQFSAAVRSSREALSIRYNNLVYELRSQGQQVTVLSLGESFFDIPLWSFRDLPFPDVYHYSHSRGLPELRSLVANFYQQVYRVNVDPAQELLITAGSKAAIYMAMQCVLDPGDEVIIREPAWVSYPEQVRLCGGVPVAMPWTDDVFQMERFIGPRTKLIVLNNPENPSGKVYSRRELEYVMDLAKANDLFVLADEAYSEFPTDGSFVSLGELDHDKQRVIVVNSLSKNFGMSGWRLGYAIGGRRLIEQMLKVNQHLITCPPTILQHYLARHFYDILEITRPQIDELDKKRKQIVEHAGQLELELMPGTATFYLFVSIAESGLTSDEFCERLLREHFISTVPGRGYGSSCDGFIRVSIGTESTSAICAALETIRRLIVAGAMQVAA